MNQNADTAPEGDRKAADVLMLKELPVLAGVVTVVAQPFAQIRQHYDDVLPDWLPLLVAAVVSLLLAVYFVRTVRRTRRDEAVFMIPLLMLMVFSASIGANNLVESASGGGRQLDAVRAAEAGAERLRAQLANAERQLEIERERGRLMRRALGLPEADAPPADEAKKLSQGDGPWWGFLVGAAHAQEPVPPRSATKPAAKPAATTPPVSDEELRRKIAEFDRQQQALKEQEQKLKQGDGAVAAGRNTRPLWKSW